MNRKKAYEKLIEDSAIVWLKLYEEEKAKREQIEFKYQELTRQVKEAGVKFANEKQIDLPLHYVDYGTGIREVQHLLKTYPPNEVDFEKEYWAKLRELPDDI